MSDIGRRIIVCGPTCSGKTTVARDIARKINIHHIEMDALFWKPDWEKTPKDEFLNRISSVLEESPDGWVIDGNYSETRVITLPQADTFIWLRPPYWAVLWRLLKRTIRRCLDKESLWGTNQESWRKAFLSRDSLILYQATHWRKYNKIGQIIAQIPHSAKVIELHSSREVDNFLSGIGENREEM